MNRLGLLLLLAATLISAPAGAQEGFRTETVQDRTFDYTDTYFLDVLTFLPPEDWQEEWDASASGYRLTVGSVRTNEFYLDEQMRVEADVTRWLRARIHLFQREDFDSRYTRLLTGGDINLTDRFSLGSYTTLLPEKEEMDIAFVASYVVDRSDYLSLSINLVDALFNEKSDSNDRIGGEPFTVKLRGRVRPANDWTLAFNVGRDFPLRVEFRDDGFDFLHRKSFYSTRLSGPVGDRWGLVVRLDGENGERQRDYDDPMHLDNMEQERDHFRFRMEWTRRLRGDFTASAGFDYFYLYEATRFVNDPAESERMLLREATVYGALRIPLPFVADGFALRPGLFVSHFSDEDLFPGNPGRTDEVDGIRSKVVTAVEHKIPGRVRLLLSATWRTDKFSFGGGNVQVQITF